MISSLEILERLLLAAALGGVIGLDRERREWAAGLRTHMLVSVGAALVIIVSAFGFADILGTPHVVLDPSRIAAQVVTGIGFLGAGTIMFLQREQVIRGLTTAAGLWSVAAIGLAAGSGMYVAAVLATLVAWVIMAGLKPLERRFFSRRSGPPRMSLQIERGTSIAPVEAAIAQAGAPLSRIELSRVDAGADRLELAFEPPMSERDMARLADQLRQLPGLVSVSFGALSTPAPRPGAS